MDLRGYDSKGLWLGVWDSELGAEDYVQRLVEMEGSRIVPPHVMGKHGKLSTEHASLLGIKLCPHKQTTVPLKGLLPQST